MRSRLSASVASTLHAVLCCALLTGAAAAEPRAPLASAGRSMAFQDPSRGLGDRPLPSMRVRLRRAATGLHVIPFPSTPDASPQSHIIFSSLHRSELRSVVATGSSSGVHPGDFEALPEDAGTAFVPKQPFAAGERVTVTATLSSSAAGTASGDPGATMLNWSFTVAVPTAAGAENSPAGVPPWTRASSSRGAGASSARASGSGPPTQRFHSAPNLHPPVVSATRDPDTRSGDIFVSPTQSPQNGAMILDSRGRLVWFHPVQGAAINLEVQRYRHRPVLTWWQPGPSTGPGAGPEDVIMDRSYQTVARVHGVEGYVPDFHEFQLTSRGSALLDVVSRVKANLSSVGGPADASILDYVIQEVDVKTGQLLWEWHSLGHIPLSASFMSLPRPPYAYDYFHLNSIQELPNGNLLVSGRHTWAVYEIDKQTGKVIWTLGGKDSSFNVGVKARFEWQHDARLHSGQILTLFDNALGPDPRTQQEQQSSAKVLKLSPATMTASLVRRYRHFPPLISGGEGSVEPLGDGDVFVGWGRAPDFSEYSRSGRQIFNVAMPLGVLTYRAFRFHWSAQPLTSPALAVSSQSNGRVRLYVSWNGATRVTAWQALGGSQRRGLRPLVRATKTGFETMIVLSRRTRYVAVRALNAQGKTLATSRVARVG